MNIVRRMIENAQQALEETAGLRLRSDARYFLLMNLSEMVVRPIQIRTGEPPFEGPPQNWAAYSWRSGAPAFRCGAETWGAPTVVGSWAPTRPRDLPAT